MKTESQVQKPRGTRELLENVSPNLYRHRENGSYYGIKKIAGKIKSHALNTADRKTADGKLRTWLEGLAETDPGNSDMTLASLLEKYGASRTDIAHSTKVGETGRIAKFRLLFPRPMETDYDDLPRSFRQQFGELRIEQAHSSRERPEH